MDNVNHPSKKTRVISPEHNLQKLFQLHGNQFIKWHFIPFLQQNDRTSLRASSTVLKRFIPAPQYIYVKITAIDQEVARLEKRTGYVESRGGGAVDDEFYTRIECVAAELQSNVVKLFSNDVAFAALKKNGKVVTWGHNTFGGDSSSVSEDLQSGVVEIFSTSGAFAALTKDGRVISWGYWTTGGNSSSVSQDLQSGVTCVVGNKQNFAALKENGKVVSWGFSDYMDNSAQRFSSLNSGVITIEAIEDGFGFRATKQDGSVIEFCKSDGNLILHNI